MNRSKKLCIIFSLLLTSEIFAAGKTVTLDIYSQVSSFSGIQTGWFAEVLQKKLNIQLDIHSDKRETPADIIIWKDNGEEYQKACLQKELLNWEENKIIQKKGKYLYSEFKNSLLKNKFMDSPDRITHGFTDSVAFSASELKQIPYSWNVRSDIYEKLEKPAVNTLNDLAELLIKMKETMPKDEAGNEMYAFTASEDDDCLEDYAELLVKAYYGYDSFGFGFYDSSSGTYYDCLAENSPYLECLKIVNKLNSKGLLPASSKNKNYSVFLDFSGTQEGMVPLTVKSAVPITFGLSIFGENHIWTISSQSENVKQCIELISWLCSPEGFLTTLYGPKGVLWNIKNEQTYFTELGKKAIKEATDIEMPKPYSGTFKEGSCKLNTFMWNEASHNPLTKEDTFSYKGWASEKEVIEVEAVIENNQNVETESTENVEKAENTDESTAKEEAEKTVDEAEEGQEAGEKNSEEAGKVNEEEEKGSKAETKKAEYRFVPVSLYVEPAVPEKNLENWKKIYDCIKVSSQELVKAKTEEEFSEKLEKMKTFMKENGFEDCNKLIQENAKKRYAAEKTALGAK